MKRSTFNKIAKQSGLTFKQGLMLSLLISESKRTKKFEGKDRVPLGDLKWYDEKKINVLHSKGFVQLDNQWNVLMTDKSNGFPNMGPQCFMGGFSDEELLAEIPEA